jgi:hypothetical protein
MFMTRIAVTDKPLGRGEFLGLGTQADAYIFDDLNKSLGVDEHDFELLARPTAPGATRATGAAPWACAWPSPRHQAGRRPSDDPAGGSVGSVGQGTSQ